MFHRIEGDPSHPQCIFYCFGDLRHRKGLQQPLHLHVLLLASFRQACFQQPAQLGELFRQLPADSWVGCDVPLGLPMGFLMARCAEGDQILGSVIAQSASRLNVMDLKTVDVPAPLAMPAVWLQDFAAELAISFKVKLQAWSSGTDPSQSVCFPHDSIVYVGE